MKPVVKLYINEQNEIFNFLKHFDKNLIDSLSTSDLLWQKEYENALEIADMIGVLIENQEDYKINMWISLDKDLLINVTPQNADEVIRYLYERYPY